MKANLPSLDVQYFPVTPPHSMETEMSEIPPHNITQFHYNRYRLLSNITFGKLREKYNAKRKAVKEALCKPALSPKINDDFDNDDYDKLNVNFSDNRLQKAKILVDFANKLKGYTCDTWKNPGCLIVEEKRMLYLFAKHYFTGEGAIFDGGICLGACTEALAGGLAKNPNRDTIDKYIWAYERAKFVGDLKAGNNKYIVDMIKHHYGETFVDFSSGDFSNLVRKNVAHLDGAEKVKLFIGDIMEQEYPDKIEIMFLDVCKTPELNFAMQKLYSRMIPGKSLLIHQDYTFPGLPWTRITMGYLAEYVEYVGSTPSNSAVWLLKKEIPQEILDVEPTSFDFRKGVRLHNYWNRVFNEKQREDIMKTFNQPYYFNESFNE